MTAIDLAQLRPDPVDEADLRWYFNESDGDMGLKSSFGPMVARLEAPLSRGGALILELDERKIAAASRARTVRRALESLQPQQAQTLREAYTTRPDHPQRPDALRRWRELAGLVDGSEVALTAWRRSGSKRTLTEWLERIVRPQASTTARASALELRREAEARLQGAMRAYSAARKRVTHTPRRAG